MKKPLNRTPYTKHEMMCKTFKYELDLPISIVENPVFKEYADKEGWNPGYMSAYVGMLILADLENGARVLKIDYEDWANS